MHTIHKSHDILFSPIFILLRHFNYQVICSVILFLLIYLILLKYIIYGNIYFFIKPLYFAFVVWVNCIYQLLVGLHFSHQGVQCSAQDYVNSWLQHVCVLLWTHLITLIKHANMHERYTGTCSQVLFELLISVLIFSILHCVWLCVWYTLPWT